MAREQALALCRDILALPRCEVLISGANTSYLCPKQSDVVSLMRDFVGNNVALLSAPEETPEAIVKVSAYCRDGAAAVEPLLAPRWRTQFRVAVAVGCDGLRGQLQRFAHAGGGGAPHSDGRCASGTAQPVF